MWGMAKHSVILFLRGRLFQDSAKVYRQVLTGAMFTALIMIVTFVGLALGGLGSEAVWIASAVAGFLGGMLQPYLFKDLKYA